MGSNKAIRVTMCLVVMLKSIVNAGRRLHLKATRAEAQTELPDYPHTTRRANPRLTQRTRKRTR